MNYSSRTVEKAVEAFQNFPGVGKKSALRMALHLAKLDKPTSEKLISQLTELVQDLRQCKKCHNFSDDEICRICRNEGRSNKLICLVETTREVMKIEDTGQFKGVYHVLGGLIKPIDGIGPDDLYIDELIERVKGDGVEEIIMALSPTIEGDTTIYYVGKLLKEYNVKITTIARGIAFGGELEYVDDLTLGRSIEARTPYTID